MITAVLDILTAAILGVLIGPGLIEFFRNALTGIFEF